MAKCIRAINFCPFFSIFQPANFPENIECFIKAQNNGDSITFANYFTEHASVSDEGSSYSGREEIKEWIQEATEKYNMQLKRMRPIEPYFNRSM